MMTRAAMALAACLLGGCAMLAPPPEAAPARPARQSIERFALEGRVAFNGPGQSFAGRVAWRHEGERDEIVLSSPLGQGFARLTGDAAGARLETADRGEFAGATVAALSEELFGVPLPFAALPGWMLGRPHASPARVERDDRQRLINLIEYGWGIAYPEYESESPAALPRRVFLRRDVIEVRFAIDRWELPE